MNQINKTFSLAAGGGVAALAALTLALGPALAMPGGGSGGNAPTTRSLQSNGQCPSGWTRVVNQSTGKSSCVRNTSGLEEHLPDVGWEGADPAFVEAAVLAHSGQYERAIAALEALGRPDDPYVLSYLGYSNRKLGNVEAALAYYHKALSIRPDYVRVREYLGEGYLALGRLDAAREQLVLIAGECGTACDAYKMLDAAIADHLAASKS